MKFIVMEVMVVSVCILSVAGAEVLDQPKVEWGSPHVFRDKPVGSGGSTMDGDDAGDTLDLSGQGLASIPLAVFERGKRLVELDLSGNKISEIPEEIGDLGLLEVLDLRGNLISSLPESICRLEKLRILGLDGNKLSEFELKNIDKLRNLHTLSIRNNNLTKLPEEIDRLENLYYLYSMHNKLTRLPEKIGGLKRIEEADFSDNLITEIPRSIGNLKTLKTLDFESNKLTLLPSEILNLVKTISRLDLEDNEIADHGEGDKVGRKELKEKFGSSVYLTQP